MSGQPRGLHGEVLPRGLSREWEGEDGLRRGAAGACTGRRAFPAASRCASEDSLRGRCSPGACAGAAPKRLIMLPWFQCRPETHTLGCHILELRFKLPLALSLPELYKPHILCTQYLKTSPSPPPFWLLTPNSLFSICSVIDKGPSDCERDSGHVCQGTTLKSLSEREWLSVGSVTFGDTQ